MQANVTPILAVSRDGSPSRASLRALDWLNALLAALQTAFGPFLAATLADRGAMPASIGLVLTVSGLAGLLVQMPAGDLIDRVASKRTLVGMGAATVISAALILGLRPDFRSDVIAAV